MDKYVLDKEQLASLQAFIISRSLRFREPAVLIEILDHFACKVEEQMQKGVPFEKAMQQAHASFGIYGFAPIADAVEQNIVRRYKGFGRKELVSILQSFHIVGIAAIGFLTYYIAHFLRQNSFTGSFAGWSLIALQGIYTMIFVPLLIRKSRKMKQHAFFSAASASSWPRYNLLFLPIVVSTLNVERLSVEAFAILITVYNCMAMISCLVLWRLHKRLITDIEHIEQQMAEISS